MSDKEDRELEL